MTLPVPHGKKGYFHTNVDALSPIAPCYPLPVPCPHGVRRGTLTKMWPCCPIGTAIGFAATYRYLKVVNTGDTDFLAKVWPALNHAMAYVVDQQQQRR